MGIEFTRRITGVVGICWATSSFSGCRPHSNEPTAEPAARPAAQVQTISSRQQFDSEFPHIAKSLDTIATRKDPLPNVVLSMLAECGSRDIKLSRSTEKSSLGQIIIEVNETLLIPRGYFLDVSGGKAGVPTVQIYALNKLVPTAEEATLLEELNAPTSLQMFTASLTRNSGQEEYGFFGARTVLSNSHSGIVLFNTDQMAKIGVSRAVALANELGNIIADRIVGRSRVGVKSGELVSDLVSLAYCTDPASFLNEVKRIYDSGLDRQGNKLSRDDAYSMTRDALTEVLYNYNVEETKRRMAGFTHGVGLGFKIPEPSPRSILGLPIDSPELVKLVRGNPKIFTDLRQAVLAWYHGKVRSMGINDSVLPQSLVERIKPPK